MVVKAVKAIFNGRNTKYLTIDWRGQRNVTNKGLKVKIKAKKYKMSHYLTKPQRFFSLASINIPILSTITLLHPSQNMAGSWTGIFKNTLKRLCCFSSF